MTLTSSCFVVSQASLILILLNKAAQVQQFFLLTFCALSVAKGMIIIMKIVAFLPAKGTSERMPSKNLILLDGKPLFLHTLEKLCKCSFIDEVYLDSESTKILEYADYLDYISLKRDSSLANNTTDGHQMFYNEVAQVDADIYIQILGTSPFIKPETIKKGIEVLLKDDKYDSVVLVRKEKQYHWNENGPKYNTENIPNSNELSDTIIETMGLYIVRKETAHKFRKRIGKTPYLLEADPIEAVDVNYPADFEVAQNIAKGLRMNEVSKLRALAKHLNSSIFSDIIDEYTGKHVIAGLKPNLIYSKFMGRANTLKIRLLKEGEDYRGIYKALETYQKIGEGEVIIVENESAGFAYFGELNANLAVRSGALGAIVSSVTRDALEVENLGFPVFSVGHSCTDVRGRATMENHNKPILIDGVKIDPGDLIFADINGIVIIPQKYEKEVLERAILSIEKEKTILGKIMNDIDALEIYQTVGEF